MKQTIPINYKFTLTGNTANINQRIAFRNGSQFHQQCHTADGDSMVLAYDEQHKLE